MTTSFSKGSLLDDDFLKNACAKNPIREHKDDKGRLTGTFFSGPVRLSYPNLFFPKHIGADPAKKPKFSVQLMYPLCADPRPLLQASARMVTEFQKIDPKLLNASNCTREKINGMATPFRDQGEKITEYSTPGALQMSCSNERKPALYLPGPHGKPATLVSNDRPLAGGQTGEWLYSGCWAIVGFQLFINKAVPEKQIPARLNSSLLSVLFFKDDKRYGGAHVDTSDLMGSAQGVEPVEIPGAEAYMAAGHPAQAAEEAFPW